MNNGSCEGYEGGKTAVCLAATRGDPPEFLELSEKVLDQVPQFVGVSVEVCRKAAVGFWRDDWFDLGLGQSLSDIVGIECPVGEELATLVYTHRPGDQSTKK
jgi:hypothetical protein